VLPDWYSVQTFNAYQFSIWPCRDKNEWEHVNGEKVSPPKYEKKVDMPPKSRKKQGKNGPKPFKHGRTIYYSHCLKANRNSGGCELTRYDFTSLEGKKMVANAQAQQQREVEEVAQHATSLDPEIQEVHQQTIHEEMVQPVN
jgi:hypothetical protein